MATALLVIAITAGEPAGIGPDLLALLAARPALPLARAGWRLPTAICWPAAPRNWAWMPNGRIFSQTPRPGARSGDAACAARRASRGRRAQRRQRPLCAQHARRRD